MLRYCNPLLQTELLQWIPQGFLLLAFSVAFSVNLASVAFTFIHGWPFLNAISLFKSLCQCASSCLPLHWWLCARITPAWRSVNNSLSLPSPPSTLLHVALSFYCLLCSSCFYKPPPSSKASRLSWWLQKCCWLHLVLAGAEPSWGSWLLAWIWCYFALKSDHMFCKLWFWPLKTRDG